MPITLTIAVTLTRHGMTAHCMDSGYTICPPDPIGQGPRDQQMQDKDNPVDIPHSTQAIDVGPSSRHSARTTKGGLMAQVEVIPSSVRLPY